MSVYTEGKLMISLDERLSLCAEFVRNGAKIADIGTDHAYLPVWLVQSGRVNSAIAADVRQGPLDNAVHTIELYSLSDKIKTVLSDGLDKISPDEADDIIIAGMGGELIVKLIDCTPWLKDKRKRLILQPMTRPETLRRYLCSNGFEIISEKACISCYKSYSVMLCGYDGKVRECDDEYAYIGSLGSDGSVEAKRYIYTINEKLKKKLRGFTQGTEEYIFLSNLIKHFSELAEEGHNDNSRGNI